jgi:hypothetical protein
MGIFPRNDNMAVMPIINSINQQIAKFGDGKRIRYLNINDKLADKDGKLFEGMTVSDGLHLDLKAYQVWADALKPIFTELLGPPAKEDHAPHQGIRAPKLRRDFSRCQCASLTSEVLRR